MTLRVLIIGSVATGPKAACRLKRLYPEAQVTMVDRDSLISYGGCGIPYFISGDVSDVSELMSTSFHMVRDEKFFDQAKGVEVLTRTEAVAIDRIKKEVLLKNLDTSQEQRRSYDKLLLATGSRPNRLPIPGANLTGVFTLSNLHEATQIKQMISGGQVGRAVVIGGGAIGLEMVEALGDLWGLDVAVVEIQDQLLPGVISTRLAQMLKHHLAEKGVTEVYLGERVLALEGNSQVELVVTDKRTLEADLVIMAVGVHPNIDLAWAAGLELSPTGAIMVNNRFQTSDPDIYAGGDCVDHWHLVSGRRVYLPSGALANRHGRIIGTNLAGAIEETDGVVGSFILKAFDLSVAATGLSLDQAREAGFQAFSVLVVQPDRAHFYPGMELMYLELIVDQATGRVLGLQGLSPQGDALSARLDAVAAILKYRPTVRDISNLEMAYAPPFASAMDILNAAGNVAENVLAGKHRAIEVDELAKLLEKTDQSGFLCLDVRSPANAAPFLTKYPQVWINVPQEQLYCRHTEIPRDRELILVCNSGARSYEAQVALEFQGLTNSRNLQGGIAALKKWGLKTD